MSLRRAELGLEEMLADPIVQLVMRRDGIDAEAVRAVVEEARRRRRKRRNEGRDWLQAAE